MTRLLRLRASIIIRLVRRINLQDRTTHHLDSRNVADNLVAFRDYIMPLGRQRIPCTRTVRNSRSDLTASTMFDIITAGRCEGEGAILLGRKGQGTAMPPDNVRIIPLPLNQHVRLIMCRVLRRNWARQELTSDGDALLNRVTSILPLVFTGLVVRRYATSRVLAVFELRSTRRVMNTLSTFEEGHGVVVRGRSVHNLQDLLRNNGRTANRATNATSIVIQRGLGTISARLFDIGNATVVGCVRVRVVNGQVAKVSSLVLSRTSITFSRHFLLRNNNKRRRLGIIRLTVSTGLMMTIAGNGHTLHLSRRASGRRIVNSY